MAKLNMEIPHELGREEATHRLKHGFGSLQRGFPGQVSDVTEQWDGHDLTFGFKVMGMKVAGNVAVEESAVKLDAQLPMAASLFKGTIEQRIREQLGRLLAA